MRGPRTSCEDAHNSALRRGSLPRSEATGTLSNMGRVDNQSLLHEFETELRARVEPVVSGVGFEWTRGNLDSSPTEVFALFEAWRNLPAVSRRLSHLPWLAVSQGKEGCIDLWIFLSFHGFGIRATLEGQDVEAWLYEQGHLELVEDLASPTDLPTAVGAMARALKVILNPPPEGAQSNQTDQA